MTSVLAQVLHTGFPTGGISILVVQVPAGQGTTRSTEDKGGGLGGAVNETQGEYTVIVWLDFVVVMIEHELVIVQ